MNTAERAGLRIVRQFAGFGGFHLHWRVAGEWPWVSKEELLRLEAAQKKTRKRKRRAKKS
jgi:hypothetical protein